jgi:hypothetical protein
MRPRGIFEIIFKKLLLRHAGGSVLALRSFCRLNQFTSLNFRADLPHNSLTRSR